MELVLKPGKLYRVASTVEWASKMKVGDTIMVLKQFYQTDDIGIDYTRAEHCTTYVYKGNVYCHWTEYFDSCCFLEEI